MWYLYVDVEADQTVRAVEGSSTVNIFCDLNRQDGVLHWKINNISYSEYNLPQVFQVVDDAGLTIEYEYVDRRMNSWTFQCIKINDEGVVFGTITTLIVIYGKWHHQT